MINDICKILESQSAQNESVNEADSPIYELARAEQVFSSNEVAKLEIASELHLQGVAIQAISSILNLSQEDLIAKFDSC